MIWRTDVKTRYWSLEPYMQQISRRGFITTIYSNSKLGFNFTSQWQKYPQALLLLLHLPGQHHLLPQTSLIRSHWAITMQLYIQFALLCWYVLVCNDVDESRLTQGPWKGICWITTALRIWTRFRITKTPGWDDFLVVVTLVSLISRRLMSSRH